jgi:WD40 repeat protein
VSRDRTTRVWEASTGKAIRVFDGNLQSVTAATFSPDSTLIVNGGRCDSSTGCDPVRVWEVSTGRRVAELHGHSGAVNSAAFSPDGKCVVTASDDETVRLWEFSTGRSLAEIRTDQGAVQRVIFSPDGGMIASSGRGSDAHVWISPMSPPSSTDLVLRGHTYPLSSIGFSPDGKLVVTGSWDGTARVWKVTGQREYLTQLHSVEELLALAQTRVGRTLTSDEKKQYLSK